MSKAALPKRKTKGVDASKERQTAKLDALKCSLLCVFLAWDHSFRFERAAQEALKSCPDLTFLILLFLFFVNLHVNKPCKYCMNSFQIIGWESWSSSILMGLLLLCIFCILHQIWKSAIFSFGHSITVSSWPTSRRPRNRWYICNAYNFNLSFYIYVSKNLLNADIKWNF